MLNSPWRVSTRVASVGLPTGAVLIDFNRPSNQVRPAAAAGRAARVEMDTDDSVDRALALCLATAANLARVTSRVRPAGRLLGAIAALSAPTAGESAAGVGLPLRSAADTLTARQHEVAILIAQGLTNRQIADALVISERTVDTHVQNILCRLELASRTQVAAWLVERVLRAAGGSYLSSR